MLRRLIERSTANRFLVLMATGALADDVRRYLGGEPVLAAPPSRAYQARKFIARHKGPVVAGALVSAALVLGVIGTGIGLVRAEQHRRSAELIAVATVGLDAVSFQREQGLDASVTALRVIADELKSGLKDLERIFAR